MKIWKAYTDRINRNCGGLGTVKDMSYWRNNLFAGTIIYLLPFCLIALVPGIYFSLLVEQDIMAIVDILITMGILVIALVPGISLRLRKIIFFSLLLILSCTLLLSLGLAGPGLLYLLAGCILSILIFPTVYSYWPAWVITIICILFAVAIFFNVVTLPRHHLKSASEWVAVSSNLVFIGFLLAALVPRLFRGLQESINKEKQLKEVFRIQQEELQEALLRVHQINNELEQFAYVASHDLQEPLRMVTTFMGKVKYNYGGQLDEKAHTYINFAVDGGKRMQKMITGLLELSRTGRDDSIKELIDLNDILKEVQQNIFKLVEENDAEINVKNALPVLLVNRFEISSLLQNLLSNAIKFRKKEINPVINVSASEQETCWLFTIEDNGIGIEKEKIEKIFEIFTRLHSQETYEGTGIGLAVCKKIVQHHGGKIWVESQEARPPAQSDYSDGDDPVGRAEGSIFYFTIKK